MCRDDDVAECSNHSLSSFFLVFFISDVSRIFLLLTAFSFSYFSAYFPFTFKFVFFFFFFILAMCRILAGGCFPSFSYIFIFFVFYHLSYIFSPLRYFLVIKTGCWQVAKISHRQATARFQTPFSPFVYIVIRRFL